MNTGWQLYEEAKTKIPGGTQLLSKRPEMWAPQSWPCYYSSAKGCEVWDLDRKHYYDFSIMGVGANVLGYAFDPVDAAAKDAIDKSGMCTLNAPEEVELARELLSLHPWADMVRYSKTGGEAMAIAVRIARAAAKKDIVLVCGYHGWSDWYLAANLVKGDPLAQVHLKGLEPAGVPRGLAGSNLIFRYNNFEEFEALVREYEGQIAAVVMEPIRNDNPEDGFLQKIRDITQQRGIVLIFDEVSAGFRLCAGGSHLQLGVNPDIAVFAKAMTNGYPLSAVIGNGNVMSAAQDSFISSTYWTERVALAATLASVRFFRENHVAETLVSTGRAVKELWQKNADQCHFHIQIGGIDPMCHFAIDDVEPLAVKTYFTQEMLKLGFLAGTGFYASIAHTEKEIKAYDEACSVAFRKIANLMRENRDISSCLDGDICHSGFERLN